MTSIDTINVYSTSRFERFRNEVSSLESLIGGHGCVFVTGSFGRGEASQFSDMDMFLVSDTAADGKTLITRVDEIKIHFGLISAIARLGFPPPDSDGRHLFTKRKLDLINNIGGDKDDYENTFTARLLLLLESRPLLGGMFYNGFVDIIIDEYWRDYGTHAGEFIPAFLINDILRLWRTFCVNYEHSKSKKEPSDIKTKIKNFKLKHSRMITCYSTIIELMHHFVDQKTIDQATMKSIVMRSPIERLRHVGEESGNQAIRNQIAEALDVYGQFLNISHQEKSKLEEQFTQQPPEIYRQNEFGKRICSVIAAFGSGNDLFRVVVV